MKYEYTPTKLKTVLCKFCEKEFKTKFGQKKFCSVKCTRLNYYKYVPPKRLCEVCSEDTGRGNKYCDKHRVYHKNKPAKPPKEVFCKKCKIDITGTGYRKYCKTCSLEVLKDKSSHYRKFANELKSQWENEGRVCVWCKSLEITVDHIIPFKKGGALMDKNNLQPMCHLCNISKGNKLAPYGECERHFLYVIHEGKKP